MAPYAHFDDKDALLDAVAEEGFVALRAALLDAKSSAPRDAPLKDVLVALAEGYVAFGLDRPGLYRTMFGRAAPEEGSIVQAAGRNAYKELIGVFADTGPDPEGRAQLAWAFIHGLTLLAGARFIEGGPGLSERIEAGANQLLLSGDEGGGGKKGAWAGHTAGQGPADLGRNAALTAPIPPVLGAPRRLKSDEFAPDGPRQTSRRNTVVHDGVISCAILQIAVFKDGLSAFCEASEIQRVSILKHLGRA